MRRAPHAVIIAMNGNTFTFPRAAAWAALACLAGLSACEAPRHNPFDPAADNYRPRAHSTITVRRLYPPHAGIAEVALREDELQLFGISNAAGVVKWTHDFRDTLRVKASATGYFPTLVKLPATGRENVWDIHLNATPQVSDAKIHSLHNNSANLTYVMMQAQIRDADGRADLLAAELQLPPTSFRAGLQLDEPMSDAYTTRFNLDRLPGNLSTADLPTLDFILVVKNVNQDSAIFGPFTVRRVITQSLRPLLPNPERPESGSILFTWERLDLPYEHFYYIILFRLEGSPFRLGEFGPIAAAQSSFILDDTVVLATLNTGWYLWILQVADRLGNRAESNAISFQYFK